MTGEIYMIITGGYKYIDLLFHNEKLWAQRVVWKSITEIIENTGLGKDTALKLVSLGANVIILCKSVEKAKNTIADIENNNKIGIQYNTIQYNTIQYNTINKNDAKLCNMQLDWSDLSSVEKIAVILQSSFYLSISIYLYLSKVDVLVRMRVLLCSFVLFTLFYVLKIKIMLNGLIDDSFAYSSSNQGWDLKNM
jgi:hypothetical protein